MSGWTLTPLAREDLRGIHDYIAERSPTAAASYVDRIFSKFDLLVRFPYLGPACDELAENLRCFVVRSHVIYYRPADEGIKIVRVLRGSWNIDSSFFTGT